jgi:choline-sulfatase
MTSEPTAAPSGDREGKGSRLCRALLGGALVGLLGGLLEAQWAAASTGVSPGAGVAMGLVTPAALMVAALGGGLAIALAPARAPGLGDLRRWLEPPEDVARAERAVLLLLGPLVAVCALVASAHVAFRSLAADLPGRVAGAVAALGAVALWAIAGLACLGASRAIARGRPGLRLPPAAALVAGLALGLLALGGGIASGDPGGGTGGFGLLGVLGRQELDLRAPGVLLACALGGMLGPAVLRRVPAWLALGATVLALGTVWIARGADPDAALSVQRGAPLGRVTLGVFQRITDRDGDGYSHLFGGGDCAPDDPAIHPGAENIPGSGIDEDCSGADAVRVELEPAAPPPPPDAAAWIRSKIPDDLNVVLITIDTLRHDLGYMGYERPVSPNIDALAARSTVFERAYALASYTGKSLGPMLIGKYTSETHRNWGHFNVFGKEDTFVHRRLSEAGIFTMSAQGHWYFGPKQGIGGGFDVEDLSAAPRVPAIEGDTTVNSDKITDAAIRMLSENGDRRFYAWVHYVDPHADYVRHEEFDFGKKGRDLYDGEVAFTDKHVGRLLDHIAGSAFGPRTAIILTSDHGEAFGEHGIYRHGFELYEEVVRVPLIVHVPGASPGRHAARRSIVAVVPTILELYGLPMPSGEGSDFVSGRSLLPDVLMPPGHTVEDRIVFVDMAAGPYNEDRQAFIEDDLKLHASSGRPLALYNLATDPGEKENLLKKDPELAQRVVARFRAFRGQLRGVVVKAPR